MKSLKVYIRFFFKALVLAGAIVAKNNQNLSAQEGKAEDWENAYEWNDSGKAGDVDPEEWAKSHPPAEGDNEEKPTAAELERLLTRNIGSDFPLEVKQWMKRIQQGKTGGTIDPFMTGNFGAALEAQAIYAQLESVLAEDKAAQAAKAKQGVLEVTNVDGKTSLALRVFRGFDQISNDSLSSAVQEAASVSGSKISLSAAEAKLLQEELKRISERALDVTLNDVDDTKLKGISKESPEKRFFIQMDRDQFQDPPKEIRDKYKEEGKLEELDNLMHGEFTGIEKTPIARMVLPGREEAFLLIDTSYTNQYSPHMLLLIARQLQRARSGQGRPVVMLFYTPGEGAKKSSVRAEIFLRPESFKDRMTTTITAAMMPPTKNEVAWAGLYTGYMILCWYFTKITAKWPEVPRGPESLEDFLRFAGDMGHFFAKYSTGIESHIFYSALIGLCYSAYTYLIFDKNVKVWKQVLRHLGWISLPAGLYTIARVNGWGLEELFFSAAGMAAITLAISNGLLNNVSRSFSHAIFAARDGHRVGMGTVPFFGFQFKRQQFFRELFTFPLLFMTKIAHLLRLQPEAWKVFDDAGNWVANSTPLVKDIPYLGYYLNQLSVGELSFYTLPFVAFAFSFTYLSYKNDGVNYAEDRKKLLKDAWTFLKAPVVIPVKFGAWACRGALRFLGDRPRGANSFDDFSHLLH